jgi:hypothetical protein
VLDTTARIPDTKHMTQHTIEQTNEKAAELFASFTPNEKSMISIGMFPALKMSAAEKAGFDGHTLVVALMKLAGPIHGGF